MDGAKVEEYVLMPHSEVELIAWVDISTSCCDEGTVQVEANTVREIR